MIEIRPLQVSTADIHGGAARAAYRLHTALRREGIDSRMLTARKTSDDPTVSVAWLYRSHLRRRIMARLVYLPRRIYKYFDAPQTPWSNNLLPTINSNEFTQWQSNLVNLHWVGSSFVPIRILPKVHMPIVWTMHDMWPFTGGCHYSGACTKYKSHCGACPQLASSRQLDLSYFIWRTKHKHWHSLNFTVVSPSRWLAECARQSALFHNKRIEVIPYGLDTEIYRPMSKPAVRAQLGLPQDAKLILFGAVRSTTDVRKGYHLLLPALHRLTQQVNHDARLANLELVVLGAKDDAGGATPPIPTHDIGFVSDEHKLAALYAAADLFVAPSLEDNLPNTVMEALACGTPTVAFNVGGMPDMIEHQANGYLATPFEVDDLAQGMTWVLADDERRAVLASRARTKVMEEFTLSHSAKHYQALYTELLAESLVSKADRT